MTLLLLVLACRNGDDRGTSVHTDQRSTSSGTTADTSGADTTTRSATGTTGAPPDSRSTADTGRTGLDTGNSTTGSTGLSAATGGTAHTGTVDTSLTTLDTCPATGHTGGAVPTGDTGCASALPACVNTVVLPAPTILYSDEVCLPVGDSGTTGHTGTTSRSCPVFSWAVHITGPQDGGVGGMASLPDGDVIVVGNDERGMTIAPGRSDEVVLPEYGTVNTNAWIARLDLDGNVVWGRRLTFSSGNAGATDVRALPDGRVVVWGDVRDEDVTFMVGQVSERFVAAAGERAFLAIVTADGELDILRFASDLDTTGLDLDEVYAGPDGTIYAVFTYEQEVTVNLGEADETTIVGGRDQVPAFAAWAPDGSFRWLHSIPEPGPNDGRYLYHLVPRDGSVEAVFATTGTTLWHPCTPFERVVPARTDGDGNDRVPQVVATYDALTGVPAAALRVSASVPPTSWTTDPEHPYGVRRLTFGVNNQVLIHANQEVPDGALMLYALDEEFQVVQPLTLGTMDPVATATPVGVSRLQANQDVVLAVDANRNVQAGATLQWACGDAVHVDPFAPITSFDSRLTWQTFRATDLQPVCGGELGVGASGVEAVLDTQGGMVFAIGLSLPHTYGAGTPQERTIVPDITDAVILRYVQ